MITKEYVAAPKTEAKVVQQIVFEVENLKPNCKPQLVSAEQVIKRRLDPNSKLESWSSNMTNPQSPGCKDLLSSPYHAFIGAVHESFNNHRGLILSPDMIWLLIAQGFAQHINDNAEKFRSRFVKFEGKKEIEVQRDCFIKGCRENTWEDVFPEFTDEIREHVGQANYDLIMENFSTTTPLERNAFELTLMDAMQSYFDYSVMTCCGIPKFTVEGTKKDWETVMKKTENLAQFELGWWTDMVMPVLEQFVNAVDGKTNTDYWKSFFKEGGGSGGPYVTGHVLRFFPYIKDHRRSSSLVRNKLMSEDKMRGLENSWGMGGLTYDKFPSGLSSVPFTWKYMPHDRNYAMKFYAGFMGSRFLGGSMRPAIGWAVTDEGKSTEFKP